jgi:hypothetical protein
MIRFTLPAIVLTSALAMGSAADAARVTFTEFTDGVAQGNTGFTMTIDPAGWVYNAVNISVTPHGGSLNGAGLIDPDIGRGDGSGFAISFFTGFTPLMPGVTASGLSGMFTSLGSTEISNGVRDIADLVLTPGTSKLDYTVEFADAGQMVGTRSGTVNVGSIPPIPVPAGLPLLLGAVALLAPLARRRARA